MDIKQYDKDNLRNILIDYIACARFIKDNYKIDRSQRKVINNQVRLANMYIKKLLGSDKISEMPQAVKIEIVDTQMRSDDIVSMKYKSSCEAQSA